MDLRETQAAIRRFSDERDWTQFHTPKNLVMALSVEVSELLEIFQWLTPEESQHVMRGAEAEHVREEVADTAIYLLRLADVLGVDLGSAIAGKLADNARRWPGTPG